ncbi:hypothetical protein [Clostridium niameyense]|uniref:hypothetical protein n=1 Tax=Clostridium niameyense TaxID=1622073 RepID=UPI00067F52BF|nr:hypothetical protein [Clostridium niameyense]
MGKLIKYNLKSYYKELIILISLILIGNIFFLSRENIWPREAIFMLSLMVCIFSNFIVFIWNIQVFSKDLYSDTCYLICSLPERGSSILGAKIITSFIQLVVVNIVAGLFFYINMIKIPQGYDAISRFINYKSVTLVCIFYVITYLELLLSAYFSISLSRITIKRRRFNKLGSFAIFLFIGWVLAKIEGLISTSFDKFINFNLVSNSVNLRFYMPNTSINVAGLIFNLISIVVMFLVISYLLEKKVEV